MAYDADPGGVFKSDTHRRVLGHLPLPDDDVTSEEDFGRRMSKDAHHGLETMDELRAVLDDLKTDGYASTSKDGWKMTQKGFEALTVSPAEAPSNNVPSRPALLRGLES